MQFSLNDIKEIQRIIANLDENDNERISEGVEWLARKSNPLYSVLRNLEPDEHTFDAIKFLEDECIEFQDKAECWFMDALKERVTAEYAIGVFKARHSYGEVA